MKNSILIATLTGLLMSSFSCKRRAAFLPPSGHVLLIYQDTISKSIQMPTKKNAFHNENLPTAYTERKFLENIAYLPCDLFSLPGNIVKYNAEEKRHELIMTSGLVSRRPTPKLIENGMVYDGKINTDANFNGSCMIGHCWVEETKLMEIVIQDVAHASILDTWIDKGAIKQLYNSVQADERKHYYFVKSATLTLINNKKYGRGQAKKHEHPSILREKGRTYLCAEKFDVKKVASLDLVSLEDF